MLQTCLIYSHFYIRSSLHRLKTISPLHTEVEILTSSFTWSQIQQTVTLAHRSAIANRFQEQGYQMLTVVRCPIPAHQNDSTGPEYLLGMSVCRLRKNHWNALLGLVWEWTDYFQITYCRPFTNFFSSWEGGGRECPNFSAVVIFILPPFPACVWPSPLSTSPNLA